MKRTIWFILVLISVFTGSCSKDTSSANLYTPTSSDITTNATLTELQQGRALYINNCGSCHNLYSPDDFSPASWKIYISAMAPRTNMNASQVLLVTKYLCRGKQ
jgi:hypothetical protein